MKKYIPIAILVFAFGCSSPVVDKEAIKTQIDTHKKEIEAINTIIEELESQIEESDTIIKHLTKVETRLISAEIFEHFIEVNGSVEAVKDAFISPEMNGQIKKIYVNEGDYVKKGDLLASLNSSVLQNSVAELENALSLAETVYNKQDKLWKQNIGSEIQYLQAKNNKESLEKKLETLNAQKELTNVRAPFSGIIDAILQKEGELAVPGMRIISLIDLEKVNVNADISESYLASIHKGAEAIISFPSYPDLEFDTKIHRTGNVIKSANRTFKIQLKLNNPSNKLKPNMVSVIKLKDFQNDSALVVPSFIIKQDIKGKFLYLAKKQGTTTISAKAYIETGMSNNKSTIVTKGINAGDRAITTGYNLVTEGTEINIIN